MPKFEQLETVSQIITAGGSHVNFSAVRPDKLKSNEITIVTVVVDVTGSVAPFAGDLLNMLQSVVEGCVQSPNVDNLVVRVLSFNTQVKEIHGFRQLHDIVVNDYKPFSPDGMTALYDATINAVASAISYAETLKQQGMVANAITFVITDGADNSSKAYPDDIAAEVNRGRQKETMDSILTLLIGVNATQSKGTLERFQKEAKLDGFIDAGDATPHRLAQVARFISASIGSQSQALGTGAPSTVLPFNH